MRYFVNNKNFIKAYLPSCSVLVCSTRLSNFALWCYQVAHFPVVSWLCRLSFVQAVDDNVRGNKDDSLASITQSEILVPLVGLCTPPSFMPTIPCGNQISRRVLSLSFSSCIQPKSMENYEK